MRIATNNLPSIDIMVPTHGKLELTMKCIQALYAHTKTKFNLIIVDDTTPEEDLTIEYCKRLEKKYTNVTFVHSDVPYTSGNQFFNIALKHCKTDYMATVMNSMQVEPEWDVVALSIMESDTKIGTIGFKCLFPNGTIESAGIAMSGYTPVDIGRDYPGHRITSVLEVLAVQWAFALHRRTALLGNLEEDVFNGFKGWDDIDNCFALRKKGWKVFYCGMGVGYHEPRSTRGDNTERARILNLQNAHAFYKRWGYWEKYLKDNKLTEEEAKQLATMATEQLKAAG
jgi:GT2 family glycosyltransferase